jgi:arsenite methyltransferase
MNMERDDEIHDEVAEAYARALAQAEGRGGCCCGSTPCAPGATTRGYGDEIAEVPEGAARSSFGCGNPVAFADVREGETVLDLGAGAGLDLLLAARKVGPRGRVIGVDMTDAMIEAARRHLAEAGATHVEVRKGLIEDLPVEDASVDVVVSNCVINLSPRKHRVFAEIRRVLRPGGRFSISDIVATDLPPSLMMSAAARAACIGGAISEDDYVAGLEAAGLTGVRVADRHVYGQDELRAMVAPDLEAVGIPPEAVEGLAGKVWSARFVGARAGCCCGS